MRLFLPDGWGSNLANVTSEQKLLTSGTWAMWNELLSSVQFFLDKYSYLHKNNQAHTQAEKSQESEAAWIRNSFLSPEEGHELLRQLCSSESCTIPLTKRQGISISKYINSAPRSTTICCPESWSHKLRNTPENIIFAVDRPKCCSSTAWQNPESKDELCNLHHNIYTISRRAPE